MHYVKPLVLAGVVLIALGGCKLTLIADTGGNISSSSGNYECAGGNTCENDIEQSASDTFTAVADSGYRFVGWSGFCLEGLAQRASRAPVAAGSSPFPSAQGLRPRPMFSCASPH